MRYDAHKGLVWAGSDSSTYGPLGCGTEPSSVSPGAAVDRLKQDMNRPKPVLGEFESGWLVALLDSGASEVAVDLALLLLLHS